MFEDPAKERMTSISAEDLIENISHSEIPSLHVSELRAG